MEWVQRSSNNGFANAKEVAPGSDHRVMSVKLESAGESDSGFPFWSRCATSSGAVRSWSGSEGEVTETSGFRRKFESADCTVDGEVGSECFSSAGVSFAGGVGAASVGLGDVWGALPVSKALEETAFCC